MASVSIYDLLIVVMIFVSMVLPFVLIFRKAGYTGWLALLLFLPIVNFFVFWWFALAKWPVQRR